MYERQKEREGGREREERERKSLHLCLKLNHTTICGDVHEHDNGGSGGRRYL